MQEHLQGSSSLICWYDNDIQIHLVLLCTKLCPYQEVLPDLKTLFVFPDNLQTTCLHHVLLHVTGVKKINRGENSQSLDWPGCLNKFLPIKTSNYNVKDTMTTTKSFLTFTCFSQWTFKIAVPLLCTWEFKDEPYVNLTSIYKSVNYPCDFISSVNRNLC